MKFALRRLARALDWHFTGLVVLPIRRVWNVLRPWAIVAGGWGVALGAFSAMAYGLRWLNSLAM